MRKRQSVDSEQALVAEWVDYRTHPGEWDVLIIFPWVAKLWRRKIMTDQLQLWSWTIINYDIPGTTPTQQYKIRSRFLFIYLFIFQVVL